MPPGPRLTTLPVLGNVFSLDFSKMEKLTDAFQRSVNSAILINFSFNTEAITSGSLLHHN